MEYRGSCGRKGRGWVAQYGEGWRQEKRMVEGWESGEILDE